MKYTKEGRETALETLRALCPPGTMVYTVLRSVARSGMSRRIDLYVIIEGAHESPHGMGLRWITGPVATVLGYALPGPGQEGIRVQGGGMDMGYAVVDDLSRALYDRGYALQHAWI